MHLVFMAYPAHYAVNADEVEFAQIVARRELREGIIV